MFFTDVTYLGASPRGFSFQWRLYWAISTSVNSGLPTPINLNIVSWYHNVKQKAKNSKKFENGNLFCAKSEEGDHCGIYGTFSMNTPIEPPDGCLEIPGFILVTEEGKSWFTQYGDVTRDFDKRGVWDTAGDADQARNRFCT